MQQAGLQQFIILGLERVTIEKAPKGSRYITRQRRREQMWQSYLKTRYPHGLNSIRVIHATDHRVAVLNLSALLSPSLLQVSTPALLALT